MFAFKKKNERKYCLQVRPSESAVTDNKPRTYASSRPNFIQRRQWANPRALILNIDGATDDYRLSISEILKKLHLPIMRKNAMLYDKSLRNQASPRPNFMQRRQWANPRALILNIEGATDHYRLSK